MHDGISSSGFDVTLQFNKSSKHGQTTVEPWVEIEDKSLSMSPDAPTLKGVNQALFSQKRPLLHHLNADTSWLLQLPRPDYETSGRRWYNVLIDPWLSGSQSDVASWFSKQWHAQPPAVGSIKALEHLCRQVESLTGHFNSEDSANSNVQTRNAVPETQSMIDVITISHEFTDHCHRETLLEAPATTPVFASTKAAELIRSWNHFSTVIDTPVFSKDRADWRTTSQAPLPSWLGIGRLVEASNMLYYHSAVLVSFALGAGDAAEAVVYTPHGIHAEPLAQLTGAQPDISTLAMLHGLHDIRLPRTQLNLGAHNGLEAQRLLRARYWIGTHDEVKKGGGLIYFLLRRKVVSVKEALEHEAQQSNERDQKLVDDIGFLEVANGQIKCLA